MRRWAAAVVALVAVSVFLPAPADAQPPGETFSGSCQLAATVRFVPPITEVPGPGTDDASGTGTCSGTLTDRTGNATRLDGAPATYAATDSGTTSCEAAEMDGSAVIRVSGVRFPMLLHEIRLGPAAGLEFEGTGGGTGVGTATVSPGADPASIVAACSSTGLSSAPVDIAVSLQAVGASTANASHMRA